jgi:hypothetical protein
LNSIYHDICRGYSEITWEGPIFIKHLDLMDQSKLQDVYDQALRKAKDSGARTENDIVKDLMANGKWPRLKEKSIKSCDEDIAQLELSKRKIKHLDQINGIYNAIEELKQKRIDLLTEKYSLIENSAEGFANYAQKEAQIAATCFRDVNFTNPAFGEDFEYLDKQSFNNLYNAYSSKDCSGEELKKLCIDPAFWTLFTLTENPYYFFGVPLYKLTINQAALLRYASNYCKIVSEISDLPEQFEGNPDKMVMYWYFKRNGGDEESHDDLEAKARRDAAELSR